MCRMGKSIETANLCLPGVGRVEGEMRVHMTKVSFMLGEFYQFFVVFLFF